MVGSVTQPQTAALTYDAENRLVSVSGSGMTASFVYDGDGNRVQSTINGVTTVYIGNYYEKSGANITQYYYAGAVRIAITQAGSGAAQKRTHAPVQRYNQQHADLLPFPQPDHIRPVGRR